MHKLHTKQHRSSRDKRQIALKEYGILIIDEVKSLDINSSRLSLPLLPDPRIASQGIIIAGYEVSKPNQTIMAEVLPSCAENTTVETCKVRQSSLHYYTRLDAMSFQDVVVSR